MTKRGKTMVMLVAGLGLLMAAGPVGAQQGVDSRLERQIGVMEKILDEVMVESPNFLVHSREASHGLYLEEFGVLFVIEASFTSDYEDWKEFSHFGGFSIEQDEDGDVIIIKKKSSKDGDGEGEEEDVSWEEIQQKRQSEQYAKGKEELIEAILDYGETLSSLKGNQWVAVAVFLDENEFLSEGKTSRLVIKARLEDLRSFSSERLSRDAMAKKLSIEEY